MITILTIVLGFFIGITVLQTVIDIFIFDIPFTLKNKNSRIINFKDIIGGSTLSLIFYFFILISSSYLIYYFKGNVIIYIADMILACLMKGNFSKQKLFSYYCNKHNNSIAGYITFAIIRNRENRNYIENYEDILHLFATYNKFAE